MVEHRRFNQNLAALPGWLTPAGPLADTCLPAIDQLAPDWQYHIALVRNSPL